MLTKDITINNSEITEARSAAFLVQKASQFESSIYIEKGDKKINAKSIMGMMSLKVKPGDTFKFVISGDDEEDAMKGICDYLAK